MRFFLQNLQYLYPFYQPGIATLPYRGRMYVALEYYRLNKISETNIVMEKKGEYEVSGKYEAGILHPKEEKAPLSPIIDTFNDRFGTDFSDSEKLFFEQIVEDCVKDEKLIDQAKTNTIDNFKFGFNDAYMNKLINRMEQNQEIFTMLMDNDDVQEKVKYLLMQEVYQRLRAWKTNEKKERRLSLKYF